MSGILDELIKGTPIRSRYHLTKLTGLGQKHLLKINRGSDFGIITAQKIAAAFGLSPGELVDKILLLKQKELSKSA